MSEVQTVAAPVLSFAQLKALTSEEILAIVEASETKDMAHEGAVMAIKALDQDGEVVPGSLPAIITLLRAGHDFLNAVGVPNTLEARGSFYAELSSATGEYSAKRRVAKAPLDRLLRSLVA